MVAMPGLRFAIVSTPTFCSKEAAIAHQNSLTADYSRLFSDIIAAMSYVLDLQEDPRLYHAWRVAAVATAMAEQMVPGQASDIFFAALLHDVGSMGAFSHIVRFPTLYSQLSKPEIVSHPERGGAIIRGIPGLETSADFVVDHHEWYSGAGYPKHKKENEIALGAQLIRIADSADISRRFRPEASLAETLEIAKIVGGMEVSPEVAEAFKMVLSNEDFYRELIDENKLFGLIQRFEVDVGAPVFQPNSDSLGTVLTVFARVIDSKHGFMCGHSERVSKYSVDLAQALGIPHNEVTKLRFAGLIHDVGKVAVPSSIIDKPGPLGQNEVLQVRHHPILTMDIIRNIVHLSELAWIAGHHHERWDGTGYPDGLAGEDIPFLSRIMAVADAFDAITSPRSYKEMKTPREALQILHEGSGTQFDPQVVDAAHAAWGSQPTQLLRAA